MNAIRNLPDPSLYEPEDRSVDFSEAVGDQQDELLMRLLRSTENAADKLNDLNGLADFLAPGVIRLLQAPYEDRSALCMAWLDEVRSILRDSLEDEAKKYVTGEYA